jgi:hypothetical protein
MIKNQIEEQFISSQSFYRTPDGRIREITVKEQFEPIILESFDPMTREITEKGSSNDSITAQTKSKSLNHNSTALAANRTG